MKNIQTRKQNQDGVTLIEYALIAAIISVALIVNLGRVKTALAATFTSVCTALGGTGC
jgi:Flp pilus assembly pilin Flp